MTTVNDRMLTTWKTTSRTTDIRATPNGMYRREGSPGSVGKDIPGSNTEEMDNGIRYSEMLRQYKMSGSMKKTRIYRNAGESEESDPQHHGGNGGDALPT